MHQTIAKSHKLLDGSALVLRELEPDSILSAEDVKALREIMMLADLLGHTAQALVILDAVRGLCRGQSTEVIQ